MTYSRKTGFTLIETLIAVAIVTIAVAGTMFSAGRATVAARIARDQLVAAYVAEEGIEYVRRMRDDAYLNVYYNVGGSDVSTTAWNDFLAGPIGQCRPPQTCTLDPSQPIGYGTSFALDAYVSPAPLYLSADGAYVQQSGVPGATETLFTRTIQIETISASEERITSTVTWSERGSNYTTRITDNLTSWQ